MKGLLYMEDIYASMPVDHMRYKFLRGWVIVVEGTIAVGKSTLCRSLQMWLERRGFSVKLYNEHINEDMLKLFLSDKQKYAFNMELYMAQERIKTYKLADIERKRRIVIIDRSIPGDLAFCLMQHRRGAISASELDLIHSVIREQELISPDCVLYLDCSPETAFSRMLSRDREDERSAYDIRYFRDLGRAYDDTIEKIDAHSSTCIHLDWSADRCASEDTRAINGYAASIMGPVSLLADGHVEAVLSKIRATYLST
jgi:deoxyadenosine/deoxycytidine kinase